MHNSYPRRVGYYLAARRRRQWLLNCSASYSLDSLFLRALARLSRSCNPKDRCLLRNNVGGSLVSQQQQEPGSVHAQAEEGANHVAFLGEVPDEILRGLCTRSGIIVAYVDLACPRSSNSIIPCRLYRGDRGDQHNSRRAGGGL